MLSDKVRVAEEKLAYLKEIYPSVLEDMVNIYIENMPEQALETLEEYEHKQENCNHILHRSDYDRYAEQIKGGPHWKLEDIEKASGICFAHKKYTRYDYAYLVNYLYALFKHFMTDPRDYIRITTALLENPMLKDADDFAYHLATLVEHS